MTVLVDQFLTRLMARVTLPSNNELLNVPRMLEMADDVIRDKMVSLMLSVNQNYFVYTENQSLVANQEAYQIPYRAIGRTLRDLKLVQNGDIRSTQNLTLVALEDEHMFNQTSVPGSFFFQGDQIILRPIPISADYYLRKFFDMQPSCLVPTSDSALVGAVSGNAVTINGPIPVNILPGTRIDFIQGKQGCRILSWDVLVTNVSANQITFTAASDVPNELSAGDWISLAQTTPVIQFPDEAIPLLITLTAARMMHAIGDFEAEERLNGAAAMQQTDLLKLIAPRIEGENTKIVNRNGLLRGQGFRTWRTRYGSFP